MHKDKNKKRKIRKSNSTAFSGISKRKTSIVKVRTAQLDAEEGGAVKFTGNSEGILSTMADTETKRLRELAKSIMSKRREVLKVLAE